MFNSNGASQKAAPAIPKIDTAGFNKRLDNFMLLEQNAINKAFENFKPSKPILSQIADSLKDGILKKNDEFHKSSRQSYIDSFSGNSAFIKKALLLDAKEKIENFQKVEKEKQLEDIKKKINDEVKAKNITQAEESALVAEMTKLLDGVYQDVQKVRDEQHSKFIDDLSSQFKEEDDLASIQELAGTAKGDTQIAAANKDNLASLLNGLQKQYNNIKLNISSDGKKADINFNRFKKNEVLDTVEFMMKGGFTKDARLDFASRTVAYSPDKHVGIANNALSAKLLSLGIPKAFLLSPSLISTSSKKINHDYFSMMSGKNIEELQKNYFDFDAKQNKWVAKKDQDIKWQNMIPIQAIREIAENAEKNGFGENGIEITGYTPNESHYNIIQNTKAFIKLCQDIYQNEVKRHPQKYQKPAAVNHQDKDLASDPTATPNNIDNQNPTSNPTLNIRQGK